MEFIERRGRPRKYNSKGQAFRDLYLDPVLSPQEICARLRISLRTFYRYEKELEAPTVRVGLGDSTGLPIKKALRATSSLTELYDIAVLRELAPRVGVRMKLVPVDLHNPKVVLRSLERGAFDIGIASLCWTRERAKTLYASNCYYFHDSPRGVLWAPVGKEIKAPRPGTKPRLLACHNSIHAEFARANLRDQFVIQTVPNMKAGAVAMLSGQAEAMLMHPLTGFESPGLSEQIEVRSRPFIYDSFTTMFFNRDSVALRPLINRALEQMHEDGAFVRLNKQLDDYVLPKSLKDPIATSRRRAALAAMSPCPSSKVT